MKSTQYAHGGMGCGIDARTVGPTTIAEQPDNTLRSPDVLRDGENSMDPKRIVADGYDRIAEAYADFVARSRHDPRDRYTFLLFDLLPPGADILELGCGSGIPTTKLLAGRFAVTGVDLSGRQIELARRQIPNATFVQTDMTRLDLPTGYFDAVVAFYSLTHVPRREHRRLLAQTASWLRPGGLLVASMGAGALPDCVEADWLGAPMFFSHYGARTNKRLVRDVGFDIISARIEQTDEDGFAVSFLWIVARKPEIRIEPDRDGILA
jgi:SAM-dependent methyltransferase